MPQNVGYGMLDNWEENLAVITANRTENDHLVIIHMGDSLWKEKDDVRLFHFCSYSSELLVIAFPYFLFFWGGNLALGLMPPPRKA